MVRCEDCNAECCRYVTVELAEPKEEADWDEIKWYLMHEGVIVYKDLDDEWQIEIKSKCKHLKGTKCDIYDKRPNVCREHLTDECDANPGEFSKVLFRKPEDVDAYRKVYNQ